jgi:pimeloyl-ACP methyl ester carboxylesterase
MGELMQKVVVRDAPLAYASIGAAPGSAPQHFIWAHGWGQDHRVFLPLANALVRLGTHSLVDFPGFGESPPPPGPWGTADYADAAADWLAALPRVRRIWIGHSFGCRVGLQLAARHPEAVDGLFLIAAAGLPRTRTLLQKVRIKSRVMLFKSLKFLPRLGIDTSSLREKFGSADYRSAGAMRATFVKVVQEDLTDTVRRVRCPVQLVYGALDGETPPEIGHRLAKLIPDASINVLPRFDHYSVLIGGAHQVQHQLEKFVGRVNP